MSELRVDVDAIGRNTEVVAAFLRRHSLDLVAVTKGCLGDPRVASVMLAGGARAIADTRDQNLRRLRKALPGVELHRIYMPSLSGTFEPGDVTYVSSLAGLAALSALRTVAASSGGLSAVAEAESRVFPRSVRAGEARRLSSGGPVGSAANPPAKVMLHVETGDLREGVPQGNLLELASAVMVDPSLSLVGISTNYACFQGKSEGIRESVRAIARAAEELRAAGIAVRSVSGGNSSLLWLMMEGERLPPEITEVRCGESLLLGHDALAHRPLPGCRQDACVLRSEVLEGYTKPAREGARRRLVLALGRQDLGSGEVRFVEPGLNEVGRSSDYLVVEAEASRPGLAPGGSIDMIPSYEALVAAWSSPYVDLRLL